MKTYTEWKDEQQKKINDIPFGFAFGKDQFLKMLEKMGLTEENCKDHLLSCGSGTFIKKEDRQKLDDWNKANSKEWKELKKNEEFMYQAFLYELANHEYIITYDYTDTLDCLDITENEFLASPMLIKAFKRAKKQYAKDMEMYF